MTPSVHAHNCLPVSVLVQHRTLLLKPFLGQGSRTGLLDVSPHSAELSFLLRKDSFGFRDQPGHKFGCVGRMAKTCVLTRPDCHEFQSSLSGSGCRNRLGPSMLHRKWQRWTAHMSEFVH